MCENCKGFYTCDNTGSFESCRYILKEEPTDIRETARELDRLMKDYDPYGYDDADYSIQQAFNDLESDPYMVVMELIKIIRADVIDE